MSNLLTHHDLVLQLSTLAGFSQHQIDKVLRNLALVVSDALSSDKTVRLPGIGDLKPKRVAARAGVCAFGAYSKPAERRVTLRPAKALREAITTLSD